MRLHNKIRLTFISITVLASFLVMGGMWILDPSGRSQAKQPVSAVFPICPSVSIASGQTIQGSIDPTDCEYQSARGDLFTFDAEAGDQVILTMTSTEFDTLLELYTSSGQLLTQDDDGGTFSNSRIVYKIESSGTYLVRARSFREDGSGAYEIRSETVNADCTLQPNGLAIWLKGEGNSVDSAGSTGGTFNGSYSPGVVGSAFTLDDQSGLVARYLAQENSFIDSWSIALWAKAGLMEGEQYLASFRTRNQNRGFSLFVHDGRLHFEVILEQNGRRTVTSAAPVITPGVYRHIAATFAAKNHELAIFVDGERLSTTEVSSDNNEEMLLSAGYVQLGSKNNGEYAPGSFFQGDVDEVQIYNRMLSPEAIYSVFTSTSAGLCENFRVKGTVLPSLRVATGDGLRSTISQRNGDYELFLEKRRSHLVQPELSSHQFSPATRVYESLQNDLTGQDFGASLANDYFASAVPLSGTSGDVVGNNSSATREIGEPIGSALGLNSVWYRWTAPRDGNFTFSLAGSPFDTLLAVYTGGTFSNLVQVAANDDVLNKATFSQLTFDASKSKEYWIAVDGKAGSLFPIGQFRLVFHPTVVTGIVVPGVGLPQGSLVTLLDLQGNLINSDVADGAGHYEIRTSGEESFCLRAYTHTRIGLLQIPSESQYIGEVSFFGLMAGQSYDFAIYLQDGGDVTFGGKIYGAASTPDLTFSATGASIFGELACWISTPTASGARSFGCSGLPAYSKIRFTPRQPGVSFSPPFLESEGVTNNLNANFFGSSASGSAIRGRVTNRGLPTLGATVSLGYLASVSRTEVDSDGYYSFENLPRGNYRLVTGFVGISAITSETVNISDLQSDQTVNFDLSNCSYNIVPPIQTVSSSGGLFSFEIQTSPECAWSAYSHSPGLTVITSSGPGTRSVSFYLSPNTGGPRSGAIVAAGRSITILQNGVVTVSGRALSPGGQGLRNVQVTLTKPDGQTIKTLTSSLGFYSFTNILTGQEYSLRAVSKRYRFASLSVTPTYNLSEFDFVGLE